MGMYNKEFYVNRHRDTLYSAQTILSLVEDVLPRLRSAIDLGCGVGTWLSVLRAKGTDVLGIDGDWVAPEFLQIPEECFVRKDIGQDIGIDRKFDLAISLEAAEHIPADRAYQLIKSLTESSDFVLFSAAIPLQGGVGHVNEQWPEYWIRLFEKQQFVPIDTIRKRIWSDEKIKFWYRQNILLFVKATRTTDLRLSDAISETIPAERYMLAYKVLAEPGIRRSARAFLAALLRRLRR